MGNDEMIRYSIWLNEALGAGNRHAVAALGQFGNAKAIYEAGAEKRAASRLFTPKELSRMTKVTLQDAAAIEEECARCGIRLIALGAPDYPYCLSVIDDPPVLLYVKGTMPDFDQTPAICIVGPRAVSDFGKKAAYSLSYRLAKAGMTVVSGGALGCDTFAHKGALKAGGVTALVMGCGMESDYLEENRELRDQVSQNGCLISEVSPHTPASKFSFPIRNRILSALCVATVLVEAGERSGALITASHAAEQGRDVFVIPGNPNLPQYAGSNALLRDGAKPLLDAGDIFGEYLPRFPGRIHVEEAFRKEPEEKKEIVHKKLSNNTLSKNAEMVYNHIRGKQFYPEDITDTGLTVGEILTALTELEFEMMIRAVPGGRYEIV